MTFKLHTGGDLRGTGGTSPKFEVGDKKGHQKCWVLNLNFFPKKVIRKFGARNLFSVSPKAAPNLRP